MLNILVKLVHRDAEWMLGRDDEPPLRKGVNAFRETKVAAAFDGSGGKWPPPPPSRLHLAIYRPRVYVRVSGEDSSCFARRRGRACFLFRG